MIGYEIEAIRWPVPGIALQRDDPGVLTSKSHTCMAQEKGYIHVAQRKCPREAEERRGEEREGTASAGEATRYITAMRHMFGITLTLIHTQHAGHGISEGKCGVTTQRVDNRIGGPGVPEPPCDVRQVPVRGRQNT
jgi:hypothetical protein